MAHKYTIMVVSKGEGDYQTEDGLMEEIQAFAMDLRERSKGKAFVLVNTEYGVDPNEYAKTLDHLKKIGDQSS